MQSDDKMVIEWEARSTDIPWAVHMFSVASAAQDPMTVASWCRSIVTVDLLSSDFGQASEHRTRQEGKKA